VALVGGVLIGAMLLARAYSDQLSEFIEQYPFWGVFLYFLLNIVDAVIAPGATLPLVPVAAKAWGHVPAALITTAGWTAGALIAFFIAREWGAPLVRKITSLDRLKQMRKHMPEDLFWSIVLMRVVMPMDLVSYVAGLFSDMSWERYVLATAIGLTPSAFVLAYLGKKTHGYEIITLGVTAVVIVGWIVVARRRHTRRRAAAAA